MPTKKPGDFSFAVVKIIIALIGVLLLTAPLAAQEDAPPCAPDLAPVRELLDQVDAAFSEGSRGDAITLMNTAREQLQILIDACAPLINLNQSVVAHNGQLTLNYPEDWVHEVVDESTVPGDPTNVQFANDSAVFDKINNVQTPALNPGDQMVYMVAGMPDAIVDGLDAAPSAPAILKAIQQNMGESNDERGFQFGEIEQLSINDRRAATVEISYSTFDVRLFVVELEREKVYVVLMALSAPGELETLTGTVQEMAASLRYDSAAP